MHACTSHVGRLAVALLCTPERLHGPTPGFVTACYDRAATACFAIPRARCADPHCAAQRQRGQVRPHVRLQWAALVVDVADRVAVWCSPHPNVASIASWTRLLAMLLTKRFVMGFIE